MAKAPVPIYTADGKPLHVGMFVYGFDTGCKVKSDATSYLIPLIVADIEHGRTRMVRLRKTDGREWRYYAEESRTHCSNDEHLIFATLEAAKKRALPIVKQLLDDMSQDMVMKKENAVEYAKTALKEKQEVFAETKKEAETLQRSYDVLANLTVQDITFPAV